MYILYVIRNVPRFQIKAIKIVSRHIVTRQSRFVESRIEAQSVFLLIKFLYLYTKATFVKSYRHRDINLGLRKILTSASQTFEKILVSYLIYMKEMIDINLVTK